MIPSAAWRYGAAFALGVLLAATAQGWRYGKKIATAEAAISSERSEAMRYILAEQQLSADKMAEADTLHTGEIADAKAHIAQLERRVTAGPTRLYVAAKCPAAAKPVPEASGPASLGSGSVEAPELDPNARPDYYALYLGIKEVEAALKVCLEGH